MPPDVRETAELRFFIAGFRGVPAGVKAGPTWIPGSERASAASRREPMPATVPFPSARASRRFSLGTRNREIPAASPLPTAERTPFTARTPPPRLSSPSTIACPLASGLICPEAARIPRAMGRSKDAPSLRTPAGARETRILSAREREAAVADCHAHTVPRLPHGPVRKPDDVDPRQAAPDVDLHGHQLPFHPDWRMT